MTTTTAYPHIVKEPGVAARLENHPRTRVAMLVMDYLARGLGPEDMIRHYPYLKLGEVHANQYVLRFFPEPYEMTIFPDGRAIVKGTSDIGVARSLYARYVGV